MTSCCANNTKEAPAKQLLREKIIPYQPLIVMVALVILASVLISQTYNIHFMPLFMGLFFLNFSMLKLFDISGFAASFAVYDIIGKKSLIYAKIYPLIELGLACAYLTAFNLHITNIITLVIMLVGLIGIVQVKRSGNAPKCACMGSLIDVPVGTVTILENTSMALMAFVMLLGL